MDKDSRFTKHYKRPECPSCGETFQPELRLGEVQHWSCQRCEFVFVVKRCERDVFGTALIEDHAEDADEELKPCRKSHCSR